MNPLRASNVERAEDYCLLLLSGDYYYAIQFSTILFYLIERNESRSYSKKYLHIAWRFDALSLFSWYIIIDCCRRCRLLVLQCHSHWTLNTIDIFISCSWNVCIFFSLANWLQFNAIHNRSVGVHMEQLNIIIYGGHTQYSAVVQWFAFHSFFIYLWVRSHIDSVCLCLHVTGPRFKETLIIIIITA